MDTTPTLPYNIKDSLSIFEYSKGLLGKTLRDFAWDDYEPKRGKGSLGQMVENIFSSSRPTTMPVPISRKLGWS